MEDLIKSYMNNSSLNEQFYTGVLNRLLSFGYKAEEKDAWTIAFCIQKVENHVKNQCNRCDVPVGLYEIGIDMVCGEFLLALKQTGQLDIKTLDLSGAVAQIKEGDTTVEFAKGSSDEEKFSNFINCLMTKGEGEFICYRKLKW